MTEVKIDENNVEVNLSIIAVDYPQSIAGIVWRYKSDESPDGKAGEFTTKIPEILLGLPNSIMNKFFLIEGAVLNHKDNPPTPYKVVVKVSQGETVLSKIVPEEGGAGQIGEEDISFVHTFVIKRK
jgi:hypothetical protein